MTVSFSLSTQELAHRLGRVLEQGDPNAQLSGVGTLQAAGPDDVTFLDNPRYRQYLEHSRAGLIIINRKYKNNLKKLSLKTAVIFSSNPYLDFARVLQLFDTRVLPVPGIHETAVIGKNCIIHPSVRIGAYCVIGDNCHIGQDSCLWPHVNVYDGVTVGERVVIHSGAVIGSDGFGNAHDGSGWVKVPQLGGVLIGHDVEIGANTTIDRGALENTIIENGVKLDNQIQIAHNVVIGAHTAIAGCTAIAGSTVIGKRCMIGGGVCITGHIHVCDAVIITGMTAVTKSIDKPGMYSSSTVAQSNLEWRKMTVRLRQLEKLFKRVECLEQAKK